METLGLILVLLTTLAAVVGIISLIIFIIAYLSKKNIKIIRNITLSSFGVAALALIGFIILSIIGSGTSPNIDESETAEATNEFEGTYTKPNKNVDTSRGDDNKPIEKEVKTEKVETEAEEESEFDKNLAEIRSEREKEEAQSENDNEEMNHEVIDNVDVYTVSNDVILSADSFLHSFSIDMTEFLSENHEDLENGVVFRLATALTDKYGNSENKIVSTVWYSQETIEKINFDNWPMDSSTDLYNTADSVVFHFSLKNETSIEMSGASDSSPAVVRDSIGQEYGE